MKYQLFNETDAILASPETFNSKEQAESCARALRQRFIDQGYYLTAYGARITPEELRLVVLPAE